MENKKETWFAKMFDRIFVEEKRQCLLPTIINQDALSTKVETSVGVSHVNLNSITSELFKIRNNQNAVSNYLHGVGQNLRLRGRVKEAEKWAKISEHVQTLVRNAYNVQTLLAQIKSLALEEEVKELELEKKRVGLQLELESLVDLEQKKKELELKSLELLILQKELEIRRIHGGETDVSPIDEAKKAEEKRFELEKLMREKSLEREKEIKRAYEELIGLGYTPEQAERWVEQERQRLAQIDHGNL